MRFRVSPIANARLDEIAAFTHESWGAEQAHAYIGGLFDSFAEIAANRLRWEPIPARLGLAGYRRKYRRHYIYWRVAVDGDVIILTILHDRMDQAARLLEDQPD